MIDRATTGDPSEFDILIIGGGMVGAALALALQQSEYRYAIVEREQRDHFLKIPKPSREQPGFASVDEYDCRVSALTAASQQFLNRQGAWPAMLNDGVSPYQSMHVWDAEGTGCIDFAAAEFYLPELGHIVENRVTQCALYQQLVGLEKQRKDFELLDAELIERLEFNDGKGLVQLQSGRSLTASLVVGADGANSMVRRMAGLPTREWDYNQDAIVATVETKQPHGCVARQRFMDSGPLAFLPLADPHHCSIVWSTTPDLADALMSKDDNAFNLALTQALESELGEVTNISTRYRFPLRQRHAKQYFDDGVVLVGDAAHTIHPLAGQGVNLGFMDAAALGDELVRASKRHLPANELSVLQRYQRRRMGANLAMAGLMEGLKHLFEEDALPIRWLRNTGMKWLNNQPFLKKQIIREAMGLSMSRQSVL
jgi:2-octaprenylphenol hydroxylase